MKKIGTLLTTIFLLVVLSCKDSGPKERFLPPSTGGINSLMVVMDTELWKGGIGDKIREHFAAPVLGLPQREPKFTITQVPPQVFKGATAYSRSVLFVDQDTLSLAHIRADVYAKPQRIAIIKGETYNELADNLDSLADKAISSFKQVEIAEAQKRFKRSLNKDAALQEEFGIRLENTITVQSGQAGKEFCMDGHTDSQGYHEHCSLSIALEYF